MLHIITHPGHRHADETLALALIVADEANIGEEVKIEFRNPTTEELDNPYIWVVDIGGRYEPMYLNFDHHQDKNLKCSLHQVAHFLGYSEILALNSWYERVDENDRFGPAFISAKYAGKNDISVFYGAIESWFFRSLKINAPDYLSSTRDGVGDWQIAVLKKLGIDMIASSMALKNNLAWIKKNAIFKTLGDGSGVCIIPKKDLLGKELFFKYVNNPNIAAICAHDERGPGWAMYRHNDNLKIDFNKIKNFPGIHFVHSNGFTGRTSEMVSIDSLVEYVELSLEK